ncbi:MAG: hypothetical protein J4F46_10190, partial [Dehalococcoidia bacterium]|nr:hypothetical protein [Dehalococcoidia bacterium]
MSQERVDLAGLPGVGISRAGAMAVAWRYTSNVGSFFRRKPLGAFRAIVAVILVVFAVFAPHIETADPPETNVSHNFAGPGA